MNDVYTASEDKRFTVAIGLDMSAAFDTINHQILLDRLQSDFGISAVALSWIRSYLTDRGQFVKIGRFSSSTTCCTSGVPQGSVLGPLLFTAYMSPLFDIISRYGVSHHQYADDVQLYLSMRACEYGTKLTALNECATAVRRWCLENGLLLNADKSEAACFGTAYQLRSVGSISLTMSDAELQLSSKVKSLGVLLDSRLTFADHVMAVVKSCNYHISAICHIRYLVTRDAAV